MTEKVEAGVTSKSMNKYFHVTLFSKTENTHVPFAKPEQDFRRHLNSVACIAGTIFFFRAKEKITGTCYAGYKRGGVGGAF